MKFSKQREIIYQYILENPNHLSADLIYSALKPTNPKLSLGTVYRNLTQLHEANIIKKISLPNLVDRFDKNLKPHGHLICKECGEIIDISFNEDTIKKFFIDNDFELEELTIVSSGKCSKCKNKS